MSIEVLPRPFGQVPELRDLPRSSRDVLRLRGRALLARARALSAELDVLLWTLATHLRLVLAAVITWFAEEPRRIRVALVGVGTSVAIGTALGLMVGVVVVRVADGVIGFFELP